MCEVSFWKLELWLLPPTSHKYLYLWSDYYTKGCAVVMKIRFKQSLSRESFGWILLNLKFICVIGTVSTYLEKWGERVPKFNKSMREKEKRWERENAWISVMWLPKFLLPDQPARVCVCARSVKCSNLKFNCGNAIAEIGEEKKICGNCGNPIAENGKGKKKVVAEI